MSVIMDMGSQIGSVAEKAGPSVVGIGEERAGGSGVMIDRGVVLTNAHNIPSPLAMVVFSDGEPARAEVLGTHLDADLAVLTVEDGGRPAIDWAPETVEAPVGLPVVGLANPGGRGIRATIGFVASPLRSFRGPRGRRIPGGFEHTAPAPPGASGGPVVDLEGRLLGINTRRLGRGFYLAQLADSSFHQLVAGVRVGDWPQPPLLGLGLAPAEVARGLRRALGLDPVDGLLVRLVEEGSPAATAGVREGDILVGVGGRAVGDVDQLHETLGGAGETLDLSLVRVNDRIDVTVRFR